MALGQILREAREQHNLTVNQVAEATHMLVQLVAEIEEEDFHRIAAAIYGRGFIRSYANLVDVDPKPLIEEFNAAYAKIEAESNKPFVPQPTQTVRRYGDGPRFGNGGASLKCHSDELNSGVSSLLGENAVRPGSTALPPQRRTAPAQQEPQPEAASAEAPAPARPQNVDLFGNEIPPDEVAVPPPPAAPAPAPAPAADQSAPKEDEALFAPDGPARGPRALTQQQKLILAGLVAAVVVIGLVLGIRSALRRNAPAPSGTESPDLVEEPDDGLPAPRVRIAPPPPGFI